MLRQRRDSGTLPFQRPNDRRGNLVSSHTVSTAHLYPAANAHDDPIDAHRLFVEVLETSSKPHPRLFFTFQASLELLRDGFGYKGAQWDATLRGHRFGAAEDGVGNLEGGLHPFRVPYLWE